VLGGRNDSPINVILYTSSDTINSEELASEKNDISKTHTRSLDVKELGLVDLRMGDAEFAGVVNAAVEISGDGKVWKA